MKSKEFCKKIQALFGVSTIDGLKEKVESSILNREMRYNGDAFECALGIRNSIKVDEIGSLN